MSSECNASCFCHFIGCDGELLKWGVVCNGFVGDNVGFGAQGAPFFCLEEFKEVGGDGDIIRSDHFVVDIPFAV